MASTSENRVEQAEQYQAMFREVNENIARLTALATETGYNLCICECSDVGCAESVEVTTAEYERVRAQGARFLVLPGHQQEAIERVVDGNGRFLVVEKLDHDLVLADGVDPRLA